MKKFVLVVAGLALLAIGLFIFLQSKDNYDPTKYYVKIDSLDKGEKIELKLPDQFGNSVELSDKTDKLLVVFDKEGAHKVIDFLKNKPKGYLNDHSVLFVADISKMPVVIRNTFALPDLRKSEFPIVLIYEKELSKKLDGGVKEGEFEIIVLDNSKIEDIIVTDDTAKMQEILEK